MSLITQGYGSGNGLITMGYGFMFIVTLRKAAKKAVSILKVALIGQRIDLIGRKQPALIKPRKVRLMSYRRRTELVGTPEVNLLSGKKKS